MSLNQVPKQHTSIIEHTRSTATVYIATTSLGFNLFFYETRDLNYIFWSHVRQFTGFPHASICLPTISSSVILFSIYNILSINEYIKFKDSFNMHSDQIKSG